MNAWYMLHPFHVQKSLHTKLSPSCRHNCRQAMNPFTFCTISDLNVYEVWFECVRKQFFFGWDKPSFGWETSLPLTGRPVFFLAERPVILWLGDNSFFGWETTLYFCWETRHSLTGRQFFLWLRDKPSFGWETSHSLVGRVIMMIRGGSSTSCW